MPPGSATEVAIVHQRLPCSPVAVRTQVVAPGRKLPVKGMEAVKRPDAAVAVTVAPVAVLAPEQLHEACAGEAWRGRQ